VKVLNGLIVNKAAENRWHLCQHLKGKQLYGDVYGIYTEVLSDFEAMLYGITSKDRQPELPVKSLK
jgi:hypothetical protein